MNKTFSNFLTDNPTFWDDHASYDVAVQSIVNDWFFYREICVNNDIKFKRMLGRKLDVLEPQFLAMYNKYMALNDITPDTLEIINRTIERVKENTVEDVVVKSMSGTDTNTRTLNTNTAKTGTEGVVASSTTTNALEDIRTLATKNKKTGTEDIDTTEGGTVGDSGSTSNLKEGSDYPMSSPTTGFENYLSNAVRDTGTSSNTQTINKTGSHDTTFNTEINDTGTITDEHNGTVDVDDSSTTTHNTAVAETGTVGDSGTTSRTGRDETDRTENGTENEEENVNRRGSTVELFEKYFSLVKRVNAVDWLINKLDACFIQVFEEDEEESTESGSSGNIEELERRVEELTTTIEKIIAGEAGPYRIFNTYTEMISASASIANGTTMFVKVDDRTPEAYHDSGAGTNTAQLKLEIPAYSGEYVTLNVTVNTDIERLSPQYNPELYTYINQFYELPEELVDIYDNYEIYNTYGTQVYPDWNFDASSSPYEANIGFSSQSNAPGTMSNSFWVKNAYGNIVFDKYANAGV